MPTEINTWNNPPFRGIDLDISKTEYPGLRVMIIDDEPDLLRLMKLILINAGFDAAAAVTCVEGLRRLPIINPDVILLDVMMPDMDGFVLYNEIRKQTDVPVIFVSAKNLVNEAVYNLRDPQAGYLSKPFHIDDLIYCVKRILKVTGPLPELAV